MSHRSIRIYATFLISLAMIFALIKLGLNDDWYSIVIALSTGFGIILQWVVSKDDRPSIKSGDEE